MSGRSSFQVKYYHKYVKTADTAGDSSSVVTTANFSQTTLGCGVDAVFLRNTVIIL